MKISVSKYEDKYRLYNLWQSVFEENNDFTSLFFDNIYNAKNCITAKEDNKIVSALHILPCEIIDGNNSVRKAQYIYGAATLKEYRCRGIMKSLLEYACEYGKKRGEEYSVLVPAEENLFKFYEKCGYQKFYKIRKVIMKRDELNKFCIRKNSIRCNFTIDNIVELRFNYIINNCGSVLWNKQHINYACKLIRAENGFIAYGENSYAFVVNDGNIAVIKEIICNKNSFGELLSEILKSTNADIFVFRLNKNSDLFVNKGNIVYNGVIKALNNKKLPMYRNPYIELVLD